jgi:hypothetical protein
MDFRKILKWFAKPTRTGADCHECERLSREEADAAIELARLDDSLPARNRLLEAREQWKAHRAVHHPLHCSSAVIL